MTGTPSPRAPRTLAEALAAGPVVLDGGLATELERAGHDLADRLWSARLLLRAPDAVRAAHARYLDAGAEVVTTASYQASFEGFAAAGVDADGVRRLLHDAVRLAREAVDGRPGRWVAASVGPYGAMLPGGQEYTGTYAARWTGTGTGTGDAADDEGLGVARLAAWHRPRLEALAEAGADVLACETVPSATEAVALLREIERLGVPAWLCLTTVTAPDGSVRTRRGEPAEPVFALAGEVPQVVAVGINCTDPASATAAVRPAARASGKPVVVYPNAGEAWDGAAGRWRGVPRSVAAAVTTWLDDGARLVGGCCRVGPADVRDLAAAVRRRRSALVPGA